MIQTGVRFLLKGGQFLNAPVPEAEADRIVRDWNSGAFRLRGEPRITGAGWGVAVDEVAALHKFVVQEEPATPPVQPPQGFFNPSAGRSGV